MTSQVWTDPGTLVTIRQAREQIQLDQSKQTETAHQTVQDELPVITEQYRTSVDVQQRLLETAESIAQLQRGLQDVESLATPLLDLLRTRAKHTISRRTAASRLDALQRLHSRVTVLQRAEEQLYAGKAEVEAVLELRAARHGARLKIDGQVQAREQKVVGATEAQLRDGFERAARAFAVGATDIGEMELRGEIPLRVVSLKEKSTNKLTYHATSVSLKDLTSSLRALGILTPLLTSLQAQVMKHLVKPLVQSHTTGQRLTVKQEDANGARLHLVPSSDEDLWQSLGLIIENLHAFLPTSFDSSGGAITSFHHHITSDTLLTIRESLLLPLLSRTNTTPDPTAAINNIAQTVKVIQQAAAFEESLTKGYETGSRLIRDFADGRAGNVYVGARKSWVLERVRGIVGGKWGHWEGVVVEMERKLSGVEAAQPESSGFGETGKSTELVADSKSAEPTAESRSMESAAEKEEDGWGLDDEPTVPPPGQPIDQVAPTTASAGTDEADGWGFDDDDLSGAKTTDSAPEPVASPPSPPIIAPKPIRQARKIGKKNKTAANTTSEGSGTASPALDSSMERFTPPPVGTRDAPRVADKAESGWEMEWEPDPETLVAVPPRVDMPVSNVVRERMKVSVALDDVIAIVIDELQFVDAFQQADITLKSFASTAEQLGTVPSETLELVRALVPARYDSQIRDIPALAVQFANDCAWLAERVRAVIERATGQGVAVDGLGKQVEKLVSLSTIVLDKQVETQTNSILDILADLEGLETTSDDQKYQLCTRAFQEVHHKLETLFRVYRDVMTESSCLSTMGQLIDTAISHICTDILALVDITAEESERLKQLCSMLRPIEDRFNDMNVNIVAFVPHWLRFCYLSEIMEASLVDITYLLESGALVDFSSDELVHLLLALFTDTPNRTELISKIMSR